MTEPRLRVMVTGGGGRIGRQVVAALRERGHPATVFDVAAPAPAVVTGASVRLGDILNLGELASALRGHDALVHLARRNATNPATFTSNVLGAYNALEAAAITGVRRVVAASSFSAVQPFADLAVPPHYLPFDEDHPLAPRGAYPLAKSVVEQICAAYAREHGMLAVAVRPTLVVGPDEYESYLRHRLENEGARRWGVRAYVDSRDVAQLCVLALERLPLGEHRVYFANGPDAGCRTPLAELLPRDYPDVPGIRELAAPLTGTRPGVSSAKAAREVGYEPRYSWRERFPELAGPAA